MNTINRIAAGVLRSPVLWGLLASLGFYALIHTGTLQGELLHRYFASHWVEYTTTVMFFVAVAQLLLKGCDVADQRGRLKQPLFGDVLPVPRPTDEAQALLGELDRLPAGERQAYLPRRLREALESVLRQGSADGLDEELKYLSEVDAARAQASSSLVRIIIWAIPMLGFLGTVIGITMAIPKLSVDAMENSLPEVMSALGVAFDTTTLALALSITLMFIQFFVDSLERGLLIEVDARASDELLKRFMRLGTDRDPQVAVLRRMSEEVVHAVERTVKRQAELWQTTIDAAHQRWNELSSGTQLQLETALAGALAKGVEAHTHRLVAAEESLTAENRRHWSGVQQSIVSSAEAFGDRLVAAERSLADEQHRLWDKVQRTFIEGLQSTHQSLQDTADTMQQALQSTTEASRAQQLELSRQSDVLLQVVEATGQVARLEETLNRNLASLSNAQHLEQTLLNLAAAINLLNARLGNVAALSPQVGLNKHAQPLDKAA